VNHQFILIVPPTGLLEVIHAEKPIDPEATIRAREHEGEFIRLTSGLIVASWMSSEYGHMNPRARQVFARVAKVHLIFTGTVLFEGIDEDRMGEMVGLLSLPDTASGGNP
jgi:hypothetical protein